MIDLCALLRLHIGPGNGDATGS